MKKSFLLAFGLLSMGAFAQNTPWSTTGNIGIGTTSPSTSLEIRKNFSTSIPSPSSQSLTNASFSAYRQSGLTTISQKLNVIQDYSSLASYSRLQAYNGSSERGYISFHTYGAGSTYAINFGYNGTTFVNIQDNGKVRIGSVSSTPAGYRLFVEDGILTEKVKVAVSGTANWADYVFADNYNLMPLNEVEAFTKENKHLPNVPSAQEMVTEGLDVAQMDAKLLEKIEELTLYLIEQNKKLEEQNQQITELKAELEKLKEQNVEE